MHIREKWSPARPEEETHSLFDIGETLKIQLMDPPSNLSDLLRGVWIPVRIEAEYPKYFVCTVLPHNNPVLSWGESKPYRYCINKMALQLGEVKFKPERGGVVKHES